MAAPGLSGLDADKMKLAHLLAKGKVEDKNVEEAGEAEER